jgi:hypothetical protein
MQHGATLKIDFWYSPTYIQPILSIFLTSQICNCITNHYLLAAITSIKTRSNFPLIKYFVNIYFSGNFKLMSILFFSSLQLYPSNHLFTTLSFQIHIQNPTVQFLSFYLWHYQSFFTPSFHFTIQCLCHPSCVLQRIVHCIIIHFIKHFISYTCVNLLWLSSNTFKTNFI